MDAPPKNIEELRALSIAIARGQSKLHLGAKAQQALSQLVDLQGDQSLLSISTLATQLDVNPSTISRLSRALGYQRFGELQRVLLSPSADSSHSFYRHQAEIALDADKDNFLLNSYALSNEHHYNIELAQRQIRTGDIENFTRTVMQARHVRLHAIRQFHSFTSFLNYGLGMIRADVSLLCDASFNVAESLATMTEDDVLIAASCQPYSKHVAEVCKVARSNNIKTITFTDHTSSPLVTYSDFAILVPHESRFISNSIVAYMAMAECLINACATTSGTTAEHELSKRDRLISELNIE
ncbi:transcriptional regulator [Halomonas salipaludis]|uniref:Transcriptional regulator n=1 Tax=Halomonas salipaludis TaxID=2032625 RepID=A0A2A2EW81_9GAMM|nr:transcriptional regulator [Halomonas salipaludis]